MSLATAQFAPFYRGDTKVFSVSFTNSSGLPLDVSGHTLWFTMKLLATDLDAAAVFQKRIVFPEDASSRNGVGSLIIESTETDNFDPGTYFFDIQKVIPGTPPVVTTMLAGKIIVLADITRQTS